MSAVRQISMFSENEETTTRLKPVNVASVPQRSPFRYPGGKTWFVPTFRRWMQSLRSKPQVLIEPFAGGGIISLTAVFERLVDKAVLVEIDHEVASVWQTIIGGDVEWLVNRILTFEVTREAVQEELQRCPGSIEEKAFQTILKNRTLHGGILAEGSRFMNYGENGKGIASRWYPKTLASRILNIARISNKLDFRCDDGLKVISEFADCKEAVFFIDPPYTAGGKTAGRRLYKHHELDHEGLFTLCESVAGHFLMTYDEAEEVKMLARKHGFDIRRVPMKNTHHRTQYELVISRNLSWLDEDAGAELARGD